jgi:hypothetical protein
MFHQYTTQIYPDDLARFHAAAKIIEVDGVEGYRTCREKFGVEISQMALVMFLRNAVGSTESYPPEGGFERVVEDVNKLLKGKNLIYE